MLTIRKAAARDQEIVWSIIKEVIAGGDTYVFDPETPKETMLAYWFGNDKHGYVATIDDEIVGSFILKDNQPGLGSHVANGSYITSSSARGKGVGEAMGRFSIEEAKRLGYRAIQFNIVVASNTGAIRLWEKIGFNKIGEIPAAFNHKQYGLTNAFIMYRTV